MASMDGGHSLAFDVEDEVAAGADTAGDPWAAFEQKDGGQGKDFKDSQGSDQASTPAEARPHTPRIRGSGFVGSVHVGPL